MSKEETQDSEKEPQNQGDAQKPSTVLTIDLTLSTSFQSIMKKHSCKIFILNV